MRYLIALLALAGLLVSCFALREHYRTGTAPCDINERWDCGVVNHSPYAEFAHVPVAVLGMAGYAAILFCALSRRWWLVLLLTTGAVGFSLWLTYVEAFILQTFCIWCVTSLGIILLTDRLAIVALGTARKQNRR
jgi:uncharacterized membrane protein